MLTERIAAFHQETKRFIIVDLFQEHSVPTQYISWVAAYFETMNLAHCFSALACEANGGDMAKTIPLAASWYLFICAADIYDDIQDGELERYESLESDILSFSLLLVALSYQTLCQLDVPLDIYREVEGRMRSAYLEAARGQMRDVDPLAPIQSDNDKQYLSKIITTTAIPFAQYLSCGACITACRNRQIEMGFYEYGLATGVSAQIKDDFKDLSNDVLQGNYTLPVLHGLSQTDHELYQELRTLIEGEKTKGKAYRIVEVLNLMGSLVSVQQLMMTYVDVAAESLQSIIHLIPNEVAKFLSPDSK